MPKGDSLSHNGESVKPLLFYCSCLPISVLLLCKSYFLAKKCDNLLLSVLARSCEESAAAVADIFSNTNKKGLCEIFFFF